MNKFTKGLSVRKSIRRVDKSQHDISAKPCHLLTFTYANAKLSGNALLENSTPSGEAKGISDMDYSYRFINMRAAKTRCEGIARMLCKNNVCVKNEISIVTYTMHLLEFNSHYNFVILQRKKYFSTI